MHALRRINTNKCRGENNQKNVSRSFLLGNTWKDVASLTKKLFIDLLISKENLE